MEHLKLLAIAQQSGIEEEQIDKLMKEQNLADYDIENVKIRLGIKRDQKTKEEKVAEAAKSRNN